MAKNKSQKQHEQPAAARPAARVQPEVAQKLSQAARMAILLAIISFVVYANTLSHGFVYDDLSAVTKNTIVAKGITAIPEIMSTPYRYGYWVVPNDTYRPLSLVLFAIEYQVAGKNPALYHFTTVALFVACVVLLFLFIDAFFERKKTVVAFMAALLFALHPIHTEVVANIKSCDELLCFLLAIISLSLCLKYTESGKTGQLLLGSLCFLLSLLAKETVISFYAVIVLVLLVYKNGNRNRSLMACAGALAAVAVFFAARGAVFAAYHIDQFAHIPLIDNGLVYPRLPFASRLASAVLILGYYIRLLIVPFPLIMDYSYNHIPFVTFADPLALLSLSAYLFIIIVGIRRFLRDHKDPIAFCIFWFLITLSLYSNTFMLIAATLGERFLFFPSVGFCLLVALLLERWAGTTASPRAMVPNKALAALVPVSLIFAALTINRNADWADNKTLYSADIRKAPQSVKLNYLLGMEFLNDAKEEKDPQKQKQGLGEGIRYISNALTIYPDYDDAQSALCDGYFRSAMYDSAEVHGKLSMKLNPNNPYTLNNMGGIAFMRKDYPETIRLCEHAIAIEPGIVDMYSNVAASFLSLGKADSGMVWLYKALQVDPSYPTTYRFFITAFRAAGKADSAAKYEALGKKNAGGI